MKKRKEKDKTMISLLWNLRKTNEQIKQNKNTFTDTENRQVVIRGKEGCRMGEMSEGAKLW